MDNITENKNIFNSHDYYINHNNKRVRYNDGIKKTMCVIPLQRNIRKKKLKRTEDYLSRHVFNRDLAKIITLYLDDKPKVILPEKHNLFNEIFMNGRHYNFSC
jgi:hypothetical protein